MERRALEKQPNSLKSVFQWGEDRINSLATLSQEGLQPDQWRQGLQANWMLTSVHMWALKLDLRIKHLKGHRLR